MRQVETSPEDRHVNAKNRMPTGGAVARRLAFLAMMFASEADRAFAQRPTPTEAEADRVENIVCEMSALIHAFDNDEHTNRKGAEDRLVEAIVSEARLGLPLDLAIQDVLDAERIGLSLEQSERLKYAIARAEVALTPQVSALPESEIILTGDPVIDRFVIDVARDTVNGSVNFYKASAKFIRDVMVDASSSTPET